MEVPVAAVVAELDLKTAQVAGLVEHRGLDTGGPIPARLAAGGGIHREDQPPTPARGGARRGRGHLAQKGIHLS